MQKFSENEAEFERLQSVSEILDNCILIEQYTQKKYKELSEQTDNQRAKHLFLHLSRAGKAHELRLNVIKNSLSKTGEITKMVSISPHIKIPQKENIPNQTGVKQTYTAMKKHLILEQNFTTTYAKLSEELKNPIATKLLEILATDETNHHQQLKELITNFEQVYQLIFEKPLKYPKK